jgi:transcriptional regulator with XRE-family HTH domain
MNNIKIAENIKEYMKIYNLNQVDLSKKLGIAQSAISAWLSGKKEPSILSLWLLADCFDCTVDELIGRTK